jgi:TctA family transporter
MACPWADFNLQLHRGDGKLSDLNKFILAQTGVDVANGQFSVCAKLAVKGGRVGATRTQQRGAYFFRRISPVTSALLTIITIECSVVATL